MHIISIGMLWNLCFKLGKWKYLKEAWTLYDSGIFAYITICQAQERNYMIWYWKHIEGNDSFYAHIPDVHIVVASDSH